MTLRIHAQATVDPLIAGHNYRVHVSGGRYLGATDVRSYVIRERSEDLAAQEGLRLFVDEMTGSGFSLGSG